MSNTLLNILLIEKNSETKAILENYLKNFEGTDVLRSCGDLFEVEEDFNYKNIDLIIFDINCENSDSVLDKIKTLKEKYKNLNFIATSYEINSELVSKTLKYNVRDFLLKPVLENVLKASVKKIKDIKNKIPFNLSRAISVFSPKGGVGKSSFALNLAYELSSLTEEKVCLLDFSTGDVATYLNQKPKFDTNYIVSKFETSDKELLLSLMNQYGNDNLYILSDNSATLNLDSKNAQKIISSLKNIFSFIIIDTPSTLDETTLSILNNSELVLLLSLPSLVSLKSTTNCLDLFRQIGWEKEKIKLIINRYTENSDINLKDIEATLKKEVFHKVPNNYLTLSDAINRAQAVSKTNPRSNIAKAYRAIANEVLNIDYLYLNDSTSYKFNHGIFNLLRRMGE